MPANNADAAKQTSSPTAHNCCRRRFLFSHVSAPWLHNPYNILYAIHAVTALRSLRPTKYLLKWATMSVDQARIDRIMQIWHQTMEATHELILAGLRLKLGPEEDLQTAYRKWYRQQRELAAERLDREAARWREQQALHNATEDQHL